MLNVPPADDHLAAGADLAGRARRGPGADVGDRRGLVELRPLDVLDADRLFPSKTTLVTNVLHQIVRLSGNCRPAPAIRPARDPLPEPVADRQRDEEDPLALCSSVDR